MINKVMMMINKYKEKISSKSEESETETIAVSSTAESGQEQAAEQLVQVTEAKTTDTDDKHLNIDGVELVKEPAQIEEEEPAQTEEEEPAQIEEEIEEEEPARIEEEEPARIEEEEPTQTEEEEPARIEKVEVIQVGDQSCVQIKGKQVPLEKLVASYISKRKERKRNRKAVFKRRQEQMLKPYQAELIALQSHLEKTNKKMIILFEGRDAAGKGGTIRRVIRYMNEKHYRVVALGKPTEEQKSQWFYQKYIQHFPTGGEIVLFDRSWYNRAMVEQVFGFCSQKEYDDFMNGVVDFEKDLTTQGITLVKLYFSVTKAEQARRFERRKTDPLRQWKLSEIDLQAQDRWDDFTNTKYTMIKNTHSHNAPWSVIRSNNKYIARREAMKVILNSVNYANRNPELDYALDPSIVISGAREIEIMDVQMNNRGKFIN